MINKIINKIINKKIIIKKGNRVSSWLPSFYFKKELFFQIEIKSSLKYNSNFNQRLKTNRLFGIVDGIFGSKKNSISIEYRYVNRSKEIQIYLVQYLDGRLIKHSFLIDYNRNIIGTKIECNIKFHKTHYEVIINGMGSLLIRTTKRKFIRKLLFPRLNIGKFNHDIKLNIKYGLVKTIYNTLC